MKKLIQFDPVVNRMLIEAGYLACFAGDVKAAHTIFAGIPETATNKAALSLGRSLVLMQKHDFTGAISELDQNATEFEGQTSQVCQALIHHINKDSEAKTRMAKELVHDGDPAISGLASSLLEAKEAQRA